MKGVVLAGGTGSRLFPATTICNKHLLPIYNSPMIFNAIKTLKSDLDIDDICIVLGGESVGDFVKLLGDGSRFAVDFTYKYQREAGGIAEAVALCRDFVHGEDFCVILGDNLFLGGNLRQFRTNFEDSGAVCGLVFAEVEHPESYGVPRFGTAFDPKEKHNLVEIQEKPKKPPSNFAVTGLYAYKSEIFDILRDLKPSVRGELEITDAHTKILKSGEEIYWVVFKGTWYDCGESFNSLLEASIIVREYERMKNENVNHR